MAWATKYVDVNLDSGTAMKAINDTGAASWEPFATELLTDGSRRIWLKREYWTDPNGNHVDKDNNVMQP